MSKLILSIDDDPSFNLLLKKFISKTSYRIETCTTVKEFFEKYTKLDPAMCLLDLNLDEEVGAGFKLLKLLREKIKKEIPIIIISKRSAGPDFSYAIELGASDFIPKPLDEVALYFKL